MNTSFFAGAFLYNPKDRTVLLHKRDMNTLINPGLWAFFGGSSEGAETPMQTILRELKEELDIVVKQEELIPLREYFNEKLQRQSYIFYVISNLKKTEMKLGEGADFDWIKLEDVFKLELTPNAKKSLEILLQRV